MIELNDIEIGRLRQILNDPNLIAALDYSNVDVVIKVVRACDEILGEVAEEDKIEIPIRPEEVTCEIMVDWAESQWSDYKLVKEDLIMGLEPMKWLDETDPDVMWVEFIKYYKYTQGDVDGFWGDEE